MNAWLQSMCGCVVHIVQQHMNAGAHCMYLPVVFCDSAIPSCVLLPLCHTALISILNAYCITGSGMSIHATYLQCMSMCW
jgi:hypothetical protein